MNPVKKLPALTSLRFMGAVMIVLQHSKRQFGIDKFEISLAPAVSFFFVLSGFILAYVYPELKGFKASCRFLLGRFARLWPAHVATFILVLLLLPSSEGLKPGWPWMMVTNLFLIHGWIPLSSYFFSYNSLSWFVSTQVFFYLSFPFLIYRWNRTWLPKLLLAFALLVIIICISNVLDLPPYAPGQDYVSLAGIIYINPLSRIFEFIFGMCLALIWSKIKQVHFSGMIYGTLIEIAAFGLVAGSMCLYPQLGALPGMELLGSAGRTYLSMTLPAPSFGILILVMAWEKGFISRLLTLPFAVFLGEISYSVYLLHQILIRFYIRHLANFSMAIGERGAYIIFWCILLLLSHLMLRLIEEPCQKLIMRLWPIKSAKVLDSPPLKSSEKPLRRKVSKQRWIVVEACVLLALMMLVFFLNSPIQSQLQPITSEYLENLERQEPQKNKISVWIDEVRNAKFTWKKLGKIRGWAFIKEADAKSTEIYIVLISKNKSYTFDTQKRLRPDLPISFKRDDLHLEDSGFVSYFSTEFMEEGTYGLGVFLKKETNASFRLTGEYVSIVNGKISRAISTLQTVEIIPEDHNVKSGIELIKNVKINCEDHIEIIGWSYVKGLDSDNNSIFVILRSSEKRYMFDTFMKKRPEVTTHFHSGFNLDNSGFMSRIPLETIQHGRHEIGILIKSGNNKYMKYSDKFITY